MNQDYILSQNELFQKGVSKYFRTPCGFKSLTHYKEHTRLLRRIEFTMGQRTDPNKGRNFDKNRLRKIKKDLNYLIKQEKQNDSQ